MQAVGVPWRCMPAIFLVWVCTMKKIIFTVVTAVMCMGWFFGGAGNSARKLDGDERPFEVFTDLARLNEYRARSEGDFFNLTDEEYSRYGEEFFVDNALVMFLTQGMSGSIRCIAEDARLEDGKLIVRVKEISPPMHTMDLHYNTLAVAVPKGIARDITAVYVESYREEVSR